MFNFDNFIAWEEDTEEILIQIYQQNDCTNRSLSYSIGTQVYNKT